MTDLNVTKDKYGMVFGVGLESSDTEKVTKPIYDKITNVLGEYDTRRTEASNGALPPYNDFVNKKIDVIKADSAKKLSVIVDSFINLADQESRGIQQMKLNVFYNSSNTNPIGDLLLMQEVRSVLRTKGTSAILKAWLGSDLFQATAILKSPVPMFPEETNDATIARGIEMRLGPVALEYQKSLDAAVSIVASYLTKAFTYIQKTPDSRIALVALSV